MCRFCCAMTSRECAECGRWFAYSPNYRGGGAHSAQCRDCRQAVAQQTAVQPAGAQLGPRGADGDYAARGCILCGGSGHSHRVCVLLGAALHRKLDPHKDMKDVLDVILRLLHWDWKETRVDKRITCLSYAPSRDVIAVGSGTDSVEAGSIVFINAQTGEKILCPVRGHSEDNPECLCEHDYPYTANPECPVRELRYVPSLFREYSLSCFYY